MKTKLYNLLKLTAFAVFMGAFANAEAQTYCGQGPTSCQDCPPVRFFDNTNGANGCNLSWFFKYDGGCTIPATPVGSLGSPTYWDCSVCGPIPVPPTWGAPNAVCNANPPLIQCGGDNSVCGCPTEIVLGNGTSSIVTFNIVPGTQMAQVNCGGTTFTVSLNYIGGVLIVSAN